MTWRATVDLKDCFHDESLTFQERRDEIVRRVRVSRWEMLAHEPDDFNSVIEELSETDDIPAFDWVWNFVYDMADRDRVWIATF